MPINWWLQDLIFDAQVASTDVETSLKYNYFPVTNKYKMTLTRIEND